MRDGAADGLLLSASQVSKFRLCARQWALRYLAKLEEPKSPSLELGIDVDDNQLQPYLREGKPLDFSRPSGDIAASGLHLLPKPKHPGMVLQKKFILPSPTRRWGYLGYKDLYLPKGGLPDNPKGVVVGWKAEGLTVGDFKTSKNISSWAKTSDELKTDVQAQLYACNALFENRSSRAREVQLSWVYFQTAGARKAERRDVIVDAEHVAEQFLEIDRTGAEVAAHYAAAPPRGSEEAKKYALGLPFNIEACGAFGGCAFRHVCNLGPADYVDSIEKGSSKRRLPIMGEVDLFADLEQRAKEPAMGVVAGGAADPAPFAGVNPPEKDLPPAPPVGSAEAAEKPKRGRPKKAVEASVTAPSAPAGGSAPTGAELVAQMEANAGVAAPVATPKSIDFKKVAGHLRALADLLEVA